MSFSSLPIYERLTTSWGGFIVAVLLVLGFIACFEIIAFNHNVRLDLTPGQIYSLSEQTIKVLKNLEQDVQFTIFYKGGNRAYHEDFFSRLSIHTPRIKYRLIHLDRHPAKAKLYGVTGYDQMVAESEGKRELVGFPSEHHVVNAIAKLVDERQKEIYFSTHHGEPSLDREYSRLAQALRTEGWKVDTINLAKKGGIPEGALVLVVAGPRKDLFEQELEAIFQYIERGGNAIFMMEPFVHLPRLERFLDGYHIIFGNDIIVDEENKLMAGDYLAPLVPYFDKGPITSTLQSAALFSSARSVKFNKEIPRWTLARYLAMSAPESWTKTNEEDVQRGKVHFEEGIDRKGPIPVAAAIKLSTGEKEQNEPGKEVVCFGDSDFVKDRFLEMFSNKDLFMNTADWLARKKDLISIRPKKYKYPYHHMTEGQGKWSFLIPVVFVPGLLLVVAIGALLLRRWRA